MITEIIKRLQRLVFVIFFALFLFIASPSKAEAYRIISLAPNTTEILFALGLEDFIVGVDLYSDYPTQARGKECVGSYDRPNVEKIILLDPDFIFISAVKRKRVYRNLDPDILLRPGPRTIEAIAKLNRIFYGKD